MISSLDIAYTGELWRLGATTGRTDELDFQYSTNATSLSSGTWTSVSALNFITPNTTGTAGARDGNAGGNFSNVSASITGVSISNGASFWTRWLDFDASASDDGLAVDDFSLTPQSTAASTWSGGGGSNNWSTAANWNSVPSNGSSLMFAGTTRLSNSNDSLTSASSITFDNTAGSFALSGNALTLAGGITNNSTSAQTIGLNLTLSAAQQFNAASGNLVVNGTVATGGNALTFTGSSNTTLAGIVSGTGALVKTGAGSQTLSGNNSYSSGTTVNSGTLVVGHVNALGTGGLAINNSATTQLQAGLSGPVQLPSLTIAGGGSPTATLDITDNNMIVHNGNLATLTAQAAAAATVNLDWTGAGLTSTTARDDANATTAVGIIQNDDGGGSPLYSTWPQGADSGGAVSVVDSDVLVKYTYYGDADLDGVVTNTFDFDLWTAGASSGGALTGWEFGDFDYDGTIGSTTDYDLWSAGFANQGSPLTVGVQPVPEPSTLVLAALGLISIVLQQLRRQSHVAAGAQSG